MPLFPSFCAGAYKTRSRFLNASTCINLYLETIASAASVKQGALYGTPGLRLLATASGVACRGVFSQDGRTWAVVADRLLEVNTTAGALTDRGQIVNDGAPVSMATNGRGGEQLAIVGGGQLKILNLLTNVLSAAIALPLTNAPVVVQFIDGYFLLLEAATIRVWFSALEDGTLWDALDFFARSQTSDNLVGIIALKDRLWAFGSQTGELYYDTGDADNPFQPYPGSVLQEGATTPWAITIQGETVLWLSQDNQGRRRMVAANNYTPVPISTPAISFEIDAYATVNDCEVLAYEQEGHAFACFSFPSANATWCYDASTQEWHRRGSWSTATGDWLRWRARGCASTDAGILVGDATTGDLYFLDLDVFTDGAADRIIRRERTVPYLSAENQWLFVDQFELGIEPGVGLQAGQGSDPQVLLEVSRNGASSWESAGLAGIGKVGEDEDTRAFWAALGRARADRLVFRVTQSDPVKTVWGPGAWLRVTAGSGQL